MADIEQPEPLEELQPVDPDLVSAEEALEASEATVAAEDEATVIIEPAPTPLGQAIAMDFEAASVIASGHSPKLVRRNAALRQWIEKCIRTHRGAHPIHPEGYGMTEPVSELIGLSGGQVLTGELASEVREALMFHPAISDVIDFDAEVANPDEVTGDAALELSFLVVTDNAGTLPVNFTLTGLVLG